MQDPIAVTAEDIRSMKVRGAGRIARAASQALQEYAGTYPGSGMPQFAEDVRRAADTLLAQRPTAISLYNGVMTTLSGLEECTDVGQAREMILTNSRDFVRGSESAQEEITAIAADRIRDGETVLTHCNSSLAVGTIIKASKQGKDIRVYATESRPWGQGYLTVAALAEAGVDTTLIIDSAVHSVMKDVDRVFVGADTVTSSGDLVNKIGTSQIALCAREARTEFNVCAESFKFSPKTLRGENVVIEERDASEITGGRDLPDGVKVFNPVFDLTPQRYIDNIICEYGVMPPGQVYGVLRRRYGRD